MIGLPHLASRLFNTPLLIQRAKLDVILSVLSPRLDLHLSAPPWVEPRTRDDVLHGEGIAVLPIHGTLVQRTHGLEALSGLSSYAALATQLDALLANEAVRGIVLDVDSPGGEAAGVFDLADRVRVAGAHKPIWAVANDAAFSAAYALASAASRVWLTRTAGVGSIGVIALHVDQSRKDEKDGLHFTALTAGARKNDGSPHHALDEPARLAIQAEVDRLHGLFVDTVASHRNLSSTAIRATEAALYFGHDAVRVGLADHVGTLEDAVRAMHAELATDNFSSPSLEFSAMTTHVPAAASPADLDEARMQARTDALAIAELCELAGQSHLTATLLGEGVTPAQARQRLLAARAGGPEIASHLTPDAAAASPATRLEDNPLVQAARARAGAR